MKNTILIVAAAAFLAFIGSQAFASCWGGPQGSRMSGFSADDVAAGNCQGALNNTTRLRQDLAAKMHAYNALMAASAPDPQQSRELEGEITALRNQLRARVRICRQPYASAENGTGCMGGYGGCW